MIHIPKGNLREFSVDQTLRSKFRLPSIRSSRVVVCGPRCSPYQQKHPRSEHFRFLQPQSLHSQPPFIFPRRVRALTNFPQGPFWGPFPVRTSPFCKKRLPFSLFLAFRFSKAQSPAPAARCPLRRRPGAAPRPPRCRRRAPARVGLPGCCRPLEAHFARCFKRQADLPRKDVWAFPWASQECPCGCLVGPKNELPYGCR